MEYFSISTCKLLAQVQLLLSNDAIRISECTPWHEDVWMGGSLAPRILKLTLNGVEYPASRLISYTRWMEVWMDFIACLHV
jgi:hypothetical protein